MMTTEKAIEKIRNLLSVANDRGASENEAMIAALKAQELMAKYSVSVSDVDCGETTDEIIECRAKVGLGNKWKYTIANIVANNFCCKLFYYGKSTIVFYGYKKHAEVAKEVFEFLFKMGNKFAQRIYLEYKNSGRNTTGVKNAYLWGFCNGIKQVLERQCTALALVVSEEVEEQYRIVTEGAGTMHSTLTISSDKKVYNKGVEDGKSVASARSLEYAC